MEANQKHHSLRQHLLHLMFHQVKQPDLKLKMHLQPYLDREAEVEHQAKQTTTLCQYLDPLLVWDLQKLEYLTQEKT